MRGTKEEVEYRIGVKISVLKERSVQECLNCKRPKCTTCPISEEDDDERRIQE